MRWTRSTVIRTCVFILFLLQDEEDFAGIIPRSQNMYVANTYIFRGNSISCFQDYRNGRLFIGKYQNSLLNDNYVWLDVNSADWVWT